MRKANMFDKNTSFVLMELGSRIAFLRRSQGKSQLSLSLDAKVTKSYLSDVERGTRNPSVMVINRICLALGVSLEELFQGIESKPSKKG